MRKCYYELLEVAKDATDDEIKKSYRKLALQWHPDKNAHRVEEATRVFAELQQAYETLSDKHERAWYDRHREAILCGGQDGEDAESISLIEFMQKCYTGFDDSEKGFFTVYRQAFEQLAREDYDYIEDPKEKMFPGFGDSKSSHAVVNAFYGFWSSFSTRRSYAWHDKYDIRQAENRHMLRAMEKENKSVREAARRERNEEIRDLAAYVRRRDPRIKAYREHLEEKKREADRKQQERRVEQLRANLEKVGVYEETEEERERRLAELEEIEAEYASTSEDDVNGENDEDGDADEKDALYCIVCEKNFRTINARRNHDQSKQHKKAVAELKRHMRKEDAQLVHDEDASEEDSPVENVGTGGKKSKKARKRAKQARAAAAESEDDEQDEDAAVGVTEDVSANGTHLDAAQQLDSEQPVAATNLFAQVSAEYDAEQAKKKKNKKEKTGTVASSTGEEAAQGGAIEPKSGRCDTCGEWFESRTRLFSHLSETGHAKLKNAPTSTAPGKNKKGKNKK